jgi:hypothetical protein
VHPYCWCHWIIEIINSYLYFVPINHLNTVTCSILSTFFLLSFPGCQISFSRPSSMILMWRQTSCYRLTSPECSSGISSVSNSRQNFLDHTGNWQKKSAD